MPILTREPFPKSVLCWSTKNRWRIWRQKLALGDCLLLGRGEELSGGRAKESLLANALEAVIAAIYLDSSFSKTKTILKRLMKPLSE